MSMAAASRRLLRPPDIPQSLRRAPYKRHKSSLSSPATKPEAVQQPAIAPIRRQRLLRRVHALTPSFLHSYAEKLVNAPISHLTSFLLLHEITAIVPLFGLAAFFHYSNWLPERASHSKWALDGTGKYGDWFIKKGWLRKIDEDQDEDAAGSFWWRMGDRRFKVVVELATAYAITKVMLPARLFLCFYATPWFARRFIEPFRSAFQKVIMKQKA